MVKQNTGLDLNAVNTTLCWTLYRGENNNTALDLKSGKCWTLYRGKNNTVLELKVVKTTICAERQNKIRYWA